MSLPGHAKAKQQVLGQIKEFKEAFLLFTNPETGVIHTADMEEGLVRYLRPPLLHFSLLISLYSAASFYLSLLLCFILSLSTSVCLSLCSSSVSLLLYRASAQRSRLIPVCVYAMMNVDCTSLY